MAYSFEFHDFDSLEQEWESILDQSSSSSIFLTPTWHKVWWEKMKSIGQELRLIKLMDGDTTLGIAPMLKDYDLITFFGSTDLWDSHDFISIKGKEQDFYQAFLYYLNTEDWSKLILESVCEGSYALSYLVEMSRSAGFNVEILEEDQLMGLQLPATWSDYLSSLNKKDRHELRRKLRRLDRDTNYSMAKIENPYEVYDLMGDFLELMSQSREEKSEFLTLGRETFFKEMAFRMADKGMLKIFFMEVDGVKTAATLCFDYKQILYLYNSGHNMEYASLGTGFLLKALCLKNAIEEGKMYYDLLRGSEGYKHHLGAKEQMLYKISITR